MKYRDKSSGILMFVVFFLTFFVLWNVADLISRVENQKQGNRKYKNSITVNLCFNEFEDLLGSEGRQEEARQYIKTQLENLCHEMQQIRECNVSFTNLYFQVKSKRETVFTEVVLQENLALPYKTEEELNPSGAVFLGESLEEFMFSQDKKKYICLNDENYLVRAELKNYGMSKQDERIVIRFHELSDSQKKSLFDQLAEYYFRYGTIGVVISFGGDSKEAVTAAYTKLEEYLATIEKLDISFVPERIPVGELNYWYKLYHSLFGVISIIFAVLNGIVVSDLWVQRHKKEYMIRLTFGYTKKRIWMLLWNELGKISVFSLLCSTVFWMLCLVIKGSEISGSMLFIQCMVMLFGSIMIVFLTTIPPLRKIMSMDPAEGLRRARG